MIRSIAAFLLLSLLLAHHSLADVVINEFMASNRTTIADEDGDFEDWIELYNAGNESVNLEGWGLSDTAANPFRWIFPPGIQIEPDGYLLVWASGKNRVLADGGPGLQIHSNFRISSAGEPLSLTRPDGTTADSVAEVVLPSDISFGRRLDDANTFAYFYRPTPGAVNAAAPFAELLSPVEFSVSPGFFSGPFELTLSHPDEQAAILFTTDGSEPHPDALGGSTYFHMSNYSSGTKLPGTMESEVYQAPLSIEDRSPEANGISMIRTHVSQNHFPQNTLKKASVVRARVWVDDALGPVSTATYFVSDDNAFDSTLPVMSLSVDEEGLFGWDDGIYVPGRDRTDSDGIPICDFGNYNRRGREAERAVHVQYFDSGSLVLDQLAGARIHGNCSRRNAFKSMRLYARGTAPEDEYFSHDFFGKPITGSPLPENLDLRRVMLRTPNFNDTAFSRLFHSVYEGVAGRIQPVQKFINGEYWGIAMLRDRFDADHLQQRFGLDRDEVSIIGIRYRHELEGGPIRFGDRVYHLSHGMAEDLDDYLAMREFAASADVADPAVMAEVEAQLAIDSFIDHLIVKIFAGDDHYAPEFVFWRVRTPQNEGLGDGRWRVHIKDFDSTLRTANYVEGLATGTHPRSFGYELFANLLNNERFRHRFINRFADLLNTHFRAERFDRIIHETYEEIAPYWSEVDARWNGVVLSNPSRPFDAGRRDALLEWSAQHPSRQREHIRSHFGIAADRELTLDVSDPEMGHIRVNQMDIDTDTPGVAEPVYPWTGVYFDGVPVELEAVPAPGYRLVGWRLDGSTEFGATDPELSLTLSADTMAEAMFEAIPLAEQPVGMHVWGFEDGDKLFDPAFSLGGGALGIVDGPETEVLANTGGDFPTQHLRVNNPLGATLTFALPTTGYEQITLDFLTRRSGQGAGVQMLSYTTDGNSWTPMEVYEVFNAPPQRLSFDFSAVPGAGDNPDFAVRITFARSQQQIDDDEGRAGNNRFDDVVLRGVALPGTKPPPVVDENRLPAVLDTVVNGPRTVSLSDWLIDPLGEPLTFSALSSDDTVLSVAVDGDSITFDPLMVGDAVVTVTASDGSNPPVALTLRSLVYPEPRALAAGAFSFSAWDPATPAGVFPAHMIFLQGEESDSALTTDLHRAYHIPADDAASPEDVAFPYAATARTRINGLGRDGISLINTGRGRDLGGALLALDTRGVDEVRVGFTVGTVLQNSRVYALRLQYRIGTEGPFSDVVYGHGSDLAGEAVEYIRAGDADEQRIGPVWLPDELLDQPNVQLLWRYYRVSGDSGPRAQLRLDDIVVTAFSEGVPSDQVFGDRFEH